MTNLFNKQLQDLNPSERPIHCSDKKRLQFYVKDDNMWKKDEDGKKMDETITTIKLKPEAKYSISKVYLATPLEVCLPTIEIRKPNAKSIAAIAIFCL